MAAQETAHHVIGIDLGGTKLAAGLIDQHLNVSEQLTEPSHELTQDQLIELIVGSVESLRARSDHPVEAVGLGIPSLIDQASGSAVMSVNLPLAGVPVRELVAQRTGLPVAIDNDGNVAALAEQRFGAAKGLDHVVVIGIGTGIAGGIVMDGKIFRGAHGSGAEIGHMTVLIDGPRCQGFCPNRGCFETMASGTAIGRYAREQAEQHPQSELGQALARGEQIDGVLATKLAKAGDAAALNVFAEAGRHLGAGLVGVVNVFNPQAIVIGGGAGAGAGELLLEPARKHISEHALLPNREQAPLLAAAFGPDAAMLGAGALALTECLDLSLKET